MECRTQYSHIQPNHKLTPKELSEFYNATELLAKQHSHYNIDKVKNKNIKTKTYRKWSAMEKYTVMLAIARTGEKDVKKLIKYVKDRSLLQVYVTTSYDIINISYLLK